MDMRASLRDVVVFAVNAKECGAHGITMLNERQTITSFLSIGDMSMGGEPQTTFEVCVCTSIGTIYASESCQDKSDINSVRLLLDQLDRIFKIVPMSTMKIPDVKERPLVSFVD